MKIWNRLAAGMAAALCLAALPMPCAAAETYSYTVLDDGTAALKCEDHAIIHAEIPAEIDGFTVTELAEGCFSGCTGLETVTIPDSVTTIQSYVFQDCTMLETVEIPASVTLLEDFIFEGCHSLTEISVDEANENYFDEDGILFKSGLSWTLMRYPAAKEEISYTTPQSCGTIAPWSFTDCKNLKTIDMPDVEAIGADAFMGCKKLRSVTIADPVRELIGASFANCTSLEKVKLPKRLRTIGDRCFFGCTELEDINFPEDLESIGEQAFYACVSLKEIVLPASLRTIGEYGLGYSINEDGDPIQIPDVVFNVPFNSAGYRYARENSFSYKSEAPQSLIIMILVGIFMIVILCFGVNAELKNRRREKAAEAERIAAERRQKAKEERRKRKK